MKKLFLVLLIVQSTFAFAQNKQTSKGVTLGGAAYSTFTDTIMFNGMGTVSDFLIGGMPFDEEYFMIARHDEFTYKQDYYISKFNYTGALIFDTVIRVVPNSSMPYTEILDFNVGQNDLTILSAFDNLLFKKQPFILNTDFSGSVNWSKYYNCDSLVFNTQSFLKLSDGGYLIGGHATNWSTISCGFVYKIDALGDIVWSKFFGFQDGIDPIGNWETTQINHLTETLDNGYIFTSSVTNVAGESFPVLVKLDMNGNVVWRNSIELGLPYTHYDGFPMVKDLKIIDYNNCMITLSAQDTSMKINTGLLIIDPSTGTHNYSKSFTLDSSGNLEVVKLIKTPNSNFVGYYNDDNYGSVLFEMSPQYDITKHVLIREQPYDSISSNHTYFEDFASTSNGGVIAVANKADYNGIFVFKTDDQLSTYCPEMYYPYFPTVDTLITNVRAVDFTNFSFPVSTIQVGIDTPITYDETNASTYCSCVNNISGYAMINSVNADSINIALYLIDDAGVFNLLTIYETDTSGFFEFSYLDEGNYALRAIPSPVKYPNYLPSYYSLSGAASFWGNATTINIFCGMNPLNYNIDLLDKYAQSGTWTCNGYVYEGDSAWAGRAANGTIHSIFAPGEPIPDIDITIDQSPGGTVSSTTTDINGYYEFTGLNNNATFVVKANLPGFPNDSVYTFMVNPGDGAMDSLNFYVMNDSVFILINNPLSINTPRIIDFNMVIAPNPTKENIGLILKSGKSSTFSITVSNALGEVIITKNPTLSVGVTNYQIEMKNEPPGIYFVKISDGIDTIYKKVIKQ